MQVVLISKHLVKQQENAIIVFLLIVFVQKYLSLVPADRQNVLKLFL